MENRHKLILVLSTTVTVQEIVNRIKQKDSRPKNPVEFKGVQKENL